MLNFLFKPRAEFSVLHRQSLIKLSKGVKNAHIVLVKMTAAVAFKTSNATKTQFEILETFCANTLFSFLYEGN